MIRSLVAVASLSLVACAQPSASATGCTKDTDCKGDRICLSGQCVSPAGITPAQSAQIQAAALRLQIDDANAKIAKLQASLATEKDPAERAALQAQLDAETARKASLLKQMP